ncbi:putative palmitoyltransferase ZDHHC16 [Blattella germanica]|nr:putative palmitoyltransferase ZDHHC16 [Blattella germanica]
MTMVQIRWKLTTIPSAIRDAVRWQWKKLKISVYSLFYNHFMDQGYMADVCMEPMFWFVDNFTKFLGPFFVAAVCCLTASVVAIAYWIGFPYWWNKSPWATVILMVVGHWLLVNICFHYYMAANTHPGYPPEGALIPEAASICKKCIAPKPPRTHHCSVCNKCILKMDHHCPWLNNCIGHYNHRYFFMYMAYMCLGVLFLIIFGFQLAYNEVWLGIDDEEEDDDSLIEGHPVRLNSSQFSSVTELMASLGNTSLLEPSQPYEGRSLRQSCLIYMAFINSGVLVSLGALTVWHSRLIGRGETSIEANINKAETKRLAEKNKVYINPYDFGKKKNWRLFLGIVKGRTWRHILLPSPHKPLGEGLTWHTVHSDTEDDLDSEEEESSRGEYLKDP